MPDFDSLRAEYGDWFFTAIWATANSGPDKRLICAQRNGVILSAWTEDEMRSKLRREVAREAEPDAS